MEDLGEDGMTPKQIFDIALSYILLPIIGILFILEPLNLDIHVYMGVEYIADHFYQLPQGWDLAWEIKPLGNRILNWALYKIAALFTPMSNYLVFSIIVKTVALIAVVLIAYYFASKVKMEYGFQLTVLSFLAIEIFQALQPEWWASLFGLLAIAFLLQDNEDLHFLTGALFIVIGLLKGITLFMFIPILCAVFLLKKDVRIYWGLLVAGSITAGLAFLTCCLIIWPHAIPDMLATAQIGHVGIASWWYVLEMEALTLIPDAIQTPIILAGLLFAFLYLFERKTIGETILFLVMFIVPLGIIFIQSELMVYHYFVLTGPAVVTFVLWYRQQTVNGGVTTCQSKS
jgi:hypothetical protein